MLVGEPQKRYYVYPSNCCFRYSFEQLGEVLADPIGHEGLPERAVYYQCLDYPLDIQPFNMLPSRHGGGIIVAHAAMEPDDRWLPSCVLGAIADIRMPPGMGPFRPSDDGGSFPAHVSVLEPQSDPFAEYPTRDGRKHQRCSTTPENVDWCENDIYWVMDVMPTKSTIRLLDALECVAMDFQLRLDWLSDAPSPLKQETSGWFPDTTLRQQWCRVSGIGRGVGLNYALTVFCSQHVRNFVGGSNIRSIHLVASIEGRPNIRSVFWSL